MNILITGATGQLGSKIVDLLLNKLPANQLAVSVTDTDKAKELKDLGVNVREGDYKNPDTLDFSGIDKLLFISSPVGNDEERLLMHKNVIESAKKYGVRFIAYTSTTKADESSAILASVHRETEKMIKESGISYSLLRNNMYLENEVQSIQAVIAGAPWLIATENGKSGWTLRQDYAEAIASVMIGEGHENTIYELSRKPITQEELALAIFDVLKKEPNIQKVDDDAYAAILKNAGIPEPFIYVLVTTQKDIREGSYEIVSDDFEKLTGRPVTPLNEAIKALVN